MRLPPQVHELIDGYLNAGTGNAVALIGRTRTFFADVLCAMSDVASALTLLTDNYDGLFQGAVMGRISIGTVVKALRDMAADKNDDGAPEQTLSGVCACLLRQTIESFHEKINWHLEVCERVTLCDFWDDFQEQRLRFYEWAKWFEIDIGVLDAVHVGMAALRKGNWDFISAVVSNCSFEFHECHLGGDMPLDQLSV